MSELRTKNDYAPIACKCLGGLNLLGKFPSYCKSILPGLSANPHPIQKPLYRVAGQKEPVFIPGCSWLLPPKLYDRLPTEINFRKFPRASAEG